MAQADPETSTDLWKVEASSEERYWAEYESMRPKYADSGFLEQIYQYHSSKPGRETSFDTAHDVACGSGKAALELTPKFRHVLASDSNLSSLQALEKLCRSRGIDNVECVECAAEGLEQHQPPLSADVITAAQSFPLFDSAKALLSFAGTLNPNGTLAVWFYGRPHFTDHDVKAKCQPLFDKILNLTFGKVIKGGPPAAKATWERAAVAMHSWLDNIDLSGKEWTNVQRRKWNPDSTQLGFGREALDFEVTPVSHVGRDDEVVKKEDPEMWKRSWDIQGVRKYVDYSFPGIDAAVAADQEIGQLFKDLEVAMGGSSVKRAYTWPVVLVLATRAES